MTFVPISEKTRLKILLTPSIDYINLNLLDIEKEGQLPFLGLLLGRKWKTLN